MCCQDNSVWIIKTAVHMTLYYLTCRSCIWWRILVGSCPQSQCTLGSGGRAPYLRAASPRGPQVCHWGGWMLWPPLLLSLQTVNKPSSEGWGWWLPIEPSEMEGAGEAAGGGGDVAVVVVVVVVVLVRDVQHQKPLFVTWPLWVDWGNCITWMPPEHLKRTKCKDEDAELMTFFLWGKCANYLRPHHTIFSWFNIWFYNRTKSWHKKNVYSPVLPYFAQVCVLFRCLVCYKVVFLVSSLRLKWPFFSGSLESTGINLWTIQSGPRSQTLGSLHADR